MDADSTYPYNPDGSREFLEDKPFLEPFSLIPALGAVTSRLRFTTFVVKVPVRNPVLLAKQADLDGGAHRRPAVPRRGHQPVARGLRRARRRLGQHRGRRLDESIAILRGLAAGGYFEFHGEIYDPARVKIAPVPAEPIPVLIGGHSDAALRRAARLGDGWMHGGGDPADLPGCSPASPSSAAEDGRGEHEPFEVHVISMDAYTVDGVRRLEDQGVTDVIVGFRWPYAIGPDTEPLSSKLDHLRRFADGVIAKT